MTVAVSEEDALEAATCWGYKPTITQEAGSGPVIDPTAGEVEPGTTTTIETPNPQTAVQFLEEYLTNQVASAARTHREAVATQAAVSQVQ